MEKTRGEIPVSNYLGERRPVVEKKQRGKRPMDELMTGGKPGGNDLAHLYSFIPLIRTAQNGTRAWRLG